MDLEQLNVQSKEALEQFPLTSLPVINQSSNIIDLYSVLNTIADQKAETLPEGVSRDDWLLNLLEEEHVNDLPYTKGNEENDKRR